MTHLIIYYESQPDILVQYLSHALLCKTKTSLITKDGIVLCCKSLVKENKIRVLITSLLEPPKTYPELYPIWAKKEFDWIYSELRGQQLLLSRMDDRRFLITTKSGNNFWLDNDVVGMFIPDLLQFVIYYNCFDDIWAFQFWLEINIPLQNFPSLYCHLQAIPAFNAE